MNDIGICVDDHSTAALSDTTNTGKDTVTASNEQLPSDDIAEINISGGESVPLMSQFVLAERSKHKRNIFLNYCSSDITQWKKTKIFTEREILVHIKKKIGSEKEIY